jgi:hypothetical protein
MCGILPFFVRETRRLCIHAQYGGGGSCKRKTGISGKTVKRRVQGNFQFRRHKASGMVAGNISGMQGSNAPQSDGG